MPGPPTDVLHATPPTDSSAAVVARNADDADRWTDPGHHGGVSLWRRTGVLVTAAVGAVLSVGVHRRRGVAAGLHGDRVAGRCLGDGRAGVHHVGETCDSDPDASCSASSSPDGTMVGFVDVPSLAIGDVRIRGERGAGSSSTQLSEVTGAGLR